MKAEEIAMDIFFMPEETPVELAVEKIHAYTRLQVEKDRKDAEDHILTTYDGSDAINAILNRPINLD